MPRLTLKGLMLPAAMAAAFAAPAPAFADPGFTKAGKLTVCTDATFPPMEYMAKAGDKTPIGFDVDLMNALAKQWKAQLEIVVLDFSGLLPALEAKRCDTVISGIFLNEARLKNFDGVGYLSSASVLVGKGDAKPIAAPAELTGKTVAVQTGTDFVKWMDEINADLKKAGKPAANVQLYPKASDVIQQVLLGRAFAGFTQDTEVAFRALQNPGQLTTVYTFPQRQTFGIYVRRQAGDGAEVKKAIDALRADGSLAKMVQTWRLSPDQLKVNQ